MKNSNSQTSGYHSGKRFIRENGMTKSSRRNRQTGMSKNKKSHGSHERSKPGSRSGSILPPPPVPPKRMDRVESDKITSLREKSSTSTYSTSTYSTSTYSSSTSTYSSCSSNSCTSRSCSESCSTCSFNDETNDKPQKEEEQKGSNSRLHLVQKGEKVSSIKSEKHATTGQAQTSIHCQKKDTTDSCLPSTSGGSCSLTARLRTVFLRHVNIPLNRLDPSLTDPRKRHKEERKEVMDLDLPLFALKSKLLKRESPEEKLRFLRQSDSKTKDASVSTSGDSVIGTPHTTIPCGGVIQKHELDGSRRNSIEERNMRNEVSKLSLTLRSLSKTSALFKEVNDKIDARKMSLKQTKMDTKEINIQKMEQEMKQLLDMFSVTSASHCSSLSGDFLHQQNADSDVSNTEINRDKHNDQQHRLINLHNISREDSTSANIDFHERRNTLPSKTLIESSNVCTPKQQMQQKSCLAPIIRQRASSSNSITHSTEECSSPLVKQHESIVDFDIQSRSLISNSQQKCRGTTSISKSIIEKDDIGNTSPQPLKKSSLIPKKPTEVPPIQQQNKTLSTISKSKNDPKKSLTPSTLFTTTSADLSANNKKIKDKDKNLEKKDHLKANIKQQTLPKMPSTSSSTIVIPKKIMSSKDEKFKEYEEMRKPKAFSVGSKDQLKSITKKKGASEHDSISQTDGKHLQKKRGHHQMRKHESSISSDSDGSDIDTSTILWDVDLDEQKRMLEAIRSGANFGMSMYDRVKRRSSQRPDDERKKSQALEQLREKKTKKKKELNRVRLSSSSSDSDESKRDKPLSSETLNLQIKREEENHYHSDVDKNNELVDDNFMEIVKQDSDKRECHKMDEIVSSIKRPQIAPKKPTMMERIEKERLADATFESKESSSSGEWSLRVSADEKSDNEEPGRVGDKIVQKLQAEFIKHRSSSPRSMDGHKDDLDQKLASLVETAKEGQHQLTSKKLDSLPDSCSSSLNSSVSSSSTSSNDTSDEDVRAAPRGFPVFKKHVPKKIAKFSMVDVFGEDSDQDEYKNEARSNVQLNCDSIVEKKKNDHDEIKTEEKSDNRKVSVMTNIKKPRRLKNESNVVVEKKTNIERKRKLERESLCTYNRFNKKETKKISHENLETKLDKLTDKVCASDSKKLKLAPSTSHNAFFSQSDRIIDKKEKLNETQMVVIATGFVEIDANVLKEQQENDETSLKSHIKHIPEQIVTSQTCDKQISNQEKQHTLNKKFDDSKTTSTIFDEYSSNQEELDAIASINPSVRLEEVVIATGFVEIDANVLKEQQENDEPSLKSRIKQIPEQIVTAPTCEKQISNQVEQHTFNKKFDDLKTTSTLFDEYSSNQEELDAIASINPSVRFEEVVIPTGFVDIDAHLLKEQQEHDKTSLKSHTKQIPEQIMAAPTCEEQISNQKQHTLNKKFDDLKTTSTLSGECSANHEELDVIASINTSVRLEEVSIATGFVEIDANVLKEQQQNEETSLKFNTKQIPEQIGTAQASDKQISNQEKQHTFSKSVSETIKQQTQSQFDDSKTTSSLPVVFGEYSSNQEEPDDIASINPSVKFGEEYDKLHRNESIVEMKAIQRNNKSSEIQFATTQSSTPSLQQHSFQQPSMPQLSFPQSNLPQHSLTQSILPQHSTLQPSMPQLSFPQSNLPQHILSQHNTLQPSMPQLSFQQSNLQHSLPQLSLQQPNLLQTSLPQSSLPQPSLPHVQFAAAQFAAAQSAASKFSATQFATPLPHVQSVNPFQKQGFCSTTQTTPIVQQLSAVQPHQFSQEHQENRQHSVTQKSFPNTWQEQLAIKNADTIVHMHKFGEQLSSFQPPQPSQPHQQKRQHCVQGSYPIVWQGQLAMKNADTLVQMHKVCGNEQLVERMNHELVSFNDQGIPLLRVNQRMRLEQSQLDNVMRKMEREENHVALICLPCGRDRNDVSVQVQKMATSFIDYYSSKNSAGIVNSHHQGCVAHIFPPSELSRTLLLRNAPEILKKVDFLGAGYLFIILTNS